MKSYTNIFQREYEGFGAAELELPVTINVPASAIQQLKELKSSKDEFDDDGYFIGDNNSFVVHRLTMLKLIYREEYDSWYYLTSLGLAAIKQYSK